MSLLPQSEIKAIGKLLKSSDESTIKLLEEQLKSFDSKTLKEIYNELPLDDIKLRTDYLKIVQKLSREQLKNKFNEWSKNSSGDLEQAVFLVALFSNPLLDTTYYSNILNDWSKQLDTNIKNLKVGNDPTSVINEVNHFLFMEIGLKGNKENYYDPDNSFVDKVIDLKKGNPILLSVIYLIVTKRIGLPFNGVNMPAHFLIQFVDSFDPIFVDPFNQGEIITKNDCHERIKKLKLNWQEEYLLSPNNKQIITRMMQNLINIYQAEGELELKEYLEHYVNIIKRTM